MSSKPFDSRICVCLCVCVCACLRADECENSSLEFLIQIISLIFRRLELAVRPPGTCPPAKRLAKLEAARVAAARGAAPIHASAFTGQDPSMISTLACARLELPSSLGRADLTSVVYRRGSGKP